MPIVARRIRILGHLSAFVDKDEMWGPLASNSWQEAAGLLGGQLLAAPLLQDVQCKVCGSTADFGNVSATSSDGL